jgi:GTP 3',8-cyclase
MTIDRFGRKINYLRLSLTERCDLRCIYCRADEGLCPKAEELPAEEFIRIVRACVELGINKVRLTGGEPLLRRDILEIVSGIAQINGIEDISLTTNALRLLPLAEELKEAGLKRVNISLDSLQAEKFHAMTSGNLDTVLAGLYKAIQVGLLPVKINAVLVKGTNDNEVDDFIELTRENPINVRFIELMPLSGLGNNQSLRVSNQDLINARPFLKSVPPQYTGQPSTDYRVEGYIGKVGFISPISHKFCTDCNRIRVMSNGTLRPCLGVDSEVSLVETLKRDDHALVEVIRQVIYNKPVGHEFEDNFHSVRDMSRIGG